MVEQTGRGTGWSLMNGYARVCLLRETAGVDQPPGVLTAIRPTVVSGVRGFRSPTRALFALRERPGAKRYEPPAPTFSLAEEFRFSPSSLPRSRMISTMLASIRSERGLR